MKHIEMIIDYTTDGTDFDYCDNHGTLIRCGECAWYSENRENYDEDDLPMLTCMAPEGPKYIAGGDDYCSRAERIEREPELTDESIDKAQYMINELIETGLLTEGCQKSLIMGMNALEKQRSKPSPEPEAAGTEEKENK